MKKTQVAVVILLLLSLFAFVNPMPIIQSANAYDYDTGAASELYSTDWLMTDTDLDEIDYAFSQIYGFFDDQYPVYGHLWNLKSLTYEWRVSNQIDDCEANHDYSTFFYYGHMALRSVSGSPPYYNWPEWSYGFREQANPNDPAPPVIWDTTHIYPATTVNSNYKFVFLWVCHNGNTKGSASPLHGMPYCWTKLSLSNDGFGDPLISESPDDTDYCFMSFENASATLSEWSGQGANDYGNWLVFFYYYLLEGGLSIEDALDYASLAVGYNGWLDNSNRLRYGYSYYWPGGGGTDEGTYWGRLRVYGNADNYLPN